MPRPKGTVITKKEKSSNNAEQIKSQIDALSEEM